MSPNTLRIALALALVTAGLAGCIGSEEEPLDASASDGDRTTEALEAPFDSFQAAMDAPGDTFEPEQEPSDLRLKLLHPSSVAGLDAGQQNVSVLLYDDAAGEPVTDANMTIQAWMLAMDHGTTQEQDPVHVANGIYMGKTLWSMDGTWLLNLDATLADGTEANFDIKFVIGQETNVDPNAEPVHHRYEDSFEDTVTDVQYANEWAFPVKAEGAHVWVNISLADATPIDELVFTLLDADGNEISSKTLSESETTATIEAASAPNEGDWTLSTTGRAVESPYTVTVVETWVTIPQLDMEMDGDGHGGHQH